MWLNPIFFNWDGMVQGSKLYSGDSWKRAHQIWSHVEQILSKPTNEFERSNAIVDLRRAIDRRVRLLSERYAFKSLPLKDKPSDTLELLEFVGIVRPRMLQRLIDIRNAVEHEDVEPPDEEMCQVYLEFTWYFLRSTDLIVQKVIDSILFEQEEGEYKYWIEVNIRPPDNWIPNIRGWIPADLVSNDHIEGWIPLKVERCEKYKDNVEGLDSKRDYESLEALGWAMKDDDVFVSAEIRGPSDILKSMYNLYFEIVW